MRRLLIPPLVGLLAVLTIGAAPPSDPLVADQWHLPFVRAFDAWDAGRGNGVVVAVVDTGVQLDHPDLRGTLLPGLDLVEPGTPPDDENGHGTLVAGVIAAQAGNGIGVSGAAPDVRILPVRVLDKDGEGTLDDVAEGIRWSVRNGAQIVNLSLAEAPNLLRGINSLLGSDLQDAIREADEAGVLVVAAAGNEGRSSTPYGSSIPVLVVGGVDRAGDVWTHSNRDQRTLYAPAVEVLSTYTDSTFAKDNGTSFSAPIVSAGAAILRGMGLSKDEARRRLIETAVPMSGNGYGRVDLAAAANIPAPATTPPVAPEVGPAGAGRAEPSSVSTASPETAVGSPSSPGSERMGSAGPAPGPTAPAPAVAGPQVVRAPTGKPDVDFQEALDAVAAPAASPRAGTPWAVGVAAVLLLANVLGLAAVFSRREVTR